jgi:hypothetical protein
VGVVVDLYPAVVSVFAISVHYVKVLGVDLLVQRWQEASQEF